MNRIRTPSPALVISCLALFVALGGVAYAAATIGSDDIINGSIRNRDFKDGTLRGNEAKPNGFGAGAIKESSLDAGQLNATRIGKVNTAGVADGLARHGVISNLGALIRGRGITSASKTGEGQYVAILDADVRNCTYSATLGDESASGPGTGQIAVTSAASNVNGVRVVTRNSTGDLADRSFHLIVSC